MRADGGDSREERLDLSVNGLRRDRPEMSAFRTLSRSQILGLLATLGGAAAVSVRVGPLSVLLVLLGLLMAAYFVSLVYNTFWLRKVLDAPELTVVSDETARSYPDWRLPSYTVLVPAYHEADVLPDLLRWLDRIDYPRDRLELKLLLEEDDEATLAAAARIPLPPSLEVVSVPAAGPRTKPKACNYGLLMTSGELVTIFDAEDRPDPLQLRRAAVAFASLPPRVACLQSKLHYHNSGQNLITQLFGAEYVTWFAALLPALPALGAPIPLGGTSMHIRRDALEAAGAWDPHNVTEDADLGIRLRRLGYETRVLDSVTYEEANSDFVNWVRQRSRWYKGYLQTWLVHMRRPVRLFREIGGSAFLGFNVVLLGTPLLALVNPIFWALTVLWFLGKPFLVQEMFPGWLYYPGMISMIFGNFVVLYRSVISLRLAGYPELVPWLLLLPIYWTMMAVAAVRAFVQLLAEPFTWDKTVHGLVAAPSGATDG